MTTAILSAKSRKEALEKMSSKDEIDILVIGGGVTGAGIALDAATRGIKVGIVEAQDWAQGTSSRSSKLVHGGLRYLYNLDFWLVAEALRERGLLLSKTAPHLVKAQPFLWPLKLPVIERAYSSVGIGMYDAMAQIAHRGSVPIQKHFSKKKTLSLFPDMRPECVKGSIQFYDSRVDDARLVVNLVRTAVRFGALAANRTQAINLTKYRGKITGATLRDAETGNTYKVKAKHIINATGVWTEQTQSMSGSTGGLKVLASKGIHIVVPRDRIKGERGIFVRTEKSVLFIIPWKRYWVIGTTDTKYHEDFRNPVANKEDIEYLLDHANAVLKSELTHADIIGTYAGIRPLLQPGTADGDKTKSTKVSREHTVTQAAPGLTVIAGGKLTTYRVMAEDAVDFALGKRMAKELPSRTVDTPLLGADGYHAMWNQRTHLAEQANLSIDHIEDMLNRYGSEITVLLDNMQADPELAKELQAAPHYLYAEIAFAVTHEGALHLEDVMCQRTRINYELPNGGLKAAREVAEIMAKLLNWDKDTLEQEVQNYTARVEAETEASEIFDESLAQAARAKAADVTEMI